MICNRCGKESCISYCGICEDCEDERREIAARKALNFDIDNYSLIEENVESLGNGDNLFIYCM